MPISNIGALNMLAVQRLDFMFCFLPFLSSKSFLSLSLVDVKLVDTYYYDYH